MEILSANLTSRVKARSKTINRSLLQLTASLRGSGSSTNHAGGESPLRSELFSADQMKLHGKTLAASHQLSPERPRDRLLTRLVENEDVLLGVRSLLTEAVQANRRLTPAGEWLLDNFYLIEEQIRTARRHLPKNYSRELPRWAHQMTEVAEKDPKSLILVIADMARSNPPLVSSFVAEFARRLQGQSPALALPLTWVEQQLSESGLTIEQLVQSENQQQAADQVSVSNTIGSLRFLGAMDWREFVETMSVVEQTLREDPGGVYGKIDFVTRDHYRHVVESIAKRSPLTEGEVARQAIQLAQERAAGGGADDRAAHVGFYLIDKGLLQFGRAARIHRSITETFQGMMGRFPFSLYLGAILLITVLFTSGLLAKVY